MSGARFAAVVLAAGLSRRMGGVDKLVASWRGRPLAAYAIEAACASRAEAVVLVTHAEGAAIRALASHPKIVHVENPEPGRGLSSSLRLGLRAAAPADAVAVLLADMPLIDAPLLDRLFAAWPSDAYALVPSMQGQWGNPALLGPEAVRHAMTLAGDSGARKLIEANRARVAVFETPDRSILRDLDAPEDFAD